jgi:hypothetical protein
LSRRKIQHLYLITKKITKAISDAAANCSVAREFTNSIAHFSIINGALSVPQGAQNGFGNQ